MTITFNFEILFFLGIEKSVEIISAFNQNENEGLRYKIHGWLKTLMISTFYVVPNVLTNQEMMKPLWIMPLKIIQNPKHPAFLVKQNKN